MAFRQRLAALMRQALKFGLVGALGLIVNLVIFNALWLTVFSPEHLHRGPLYATAVAAGASIATNWLGNRYWAFRLQRGTRLVREAAEFLLVTIVSLGIPLACVWVSHYVLGFTSLLADNVANNVVGLAIGSVFRFALYRWWVFLPARNMASTPRPVTTETGSLALPPRGGLPE